MKIEVTKRNINHVKGLIEKIGNNKSLTDTFYYPTSKKEKNILKSLGIDRFIVVQSNESTFNSFSIERDFMHGHSFLRVHNNIIDNDFRAFLIEIGDVIEIKNNIIYIKAFHPTRRRDKGVRVIRFV